MMLIRIHKLKSYIRPGTLSELGLKSMQFPLWSCAFSRSWFRFLGRNLAYSYILGRFQERLYPWPFVDLTAGPRFSFTVNGAIGTLPALTTCL